MPAIFIIMAYIILIKLADLFDQSQSQTDCFSGGCEFFLKRSNSSAVATRGAVLPYSQFSIHRFDGYRDFSSLQYNGIIDEIEIRFQSSERHGLH